MTEAVATLLFVGQVVLDQVFQVERFSADGGKGVAGGHVMRIGGLATNAARAAHRLRDPASGPRVRLVSAVGVDVAGDVLRQALADDGLDCRGVARVGAARTGVSAVLVDAAGERQVHSFRGDALARAAVPADLLPPGCAGVLVDPRWPEAAAQALRQARAAGVVSVLDGEVAPREVLQALLPLAAWCVFSRQGLAAWLGEGADPTAARPQPGDAGGPPVPQRALARAHGIAPE
ncbi:PfkB family carbohydrate kinase, partial [Ideonella sp. A 288]|uniref:PfkB family carbohydrate kinase n=1 Tax=Ideonella sp. A 288 TaxID=1962181 RepID=UPI001F3275B9